MRPFLLPLIPILALNAANSLPEQGHCQPIQNDYTANYDDLPFTEPGPNPIPDPYLGLTYTIFQVDQSDGFIPPTSGNQWTMAFGGSGNISIPVDSPKATFALHTFSYACDAGIPQPECAISIWGWKEDGKVIERTIYYPRLDPGHVLADFKMNKTTFNPQWSDLKSVGFSIASADNGGDMYGGLALDGVAYTITERKC